MLPLLAACGGSTTSSGGAPDAGPSHTLYVTVYGTDSVAVIDEASRKVTANIPLASGAGPAILLKTPDGKKLYSANWKNNTISAIDVATQAVTPIALGSRAWVEAMSPAGDVVYAGLNANTIAVISTATDTITRMIDTGGDLAESIIVSPDGKTLYVALVNQNDLASLLAPGTITAIDAATGMVTHPAVTVGETPAWVTVSPDGSKVYSLNFLGNSASVIDAASWTVTATPSTGAGSQPIIGTTAPSGALLVTNFGTASVVVLDPTTNAITQTIKTTGRPVGIDVSADGKEAYATEFGPDSLKINPNPLTLLMGDLSGEIGTQPGSVVIFDPATGVALGDPISVGAAGPTSVVVE